MNDECGPHILYSYIEEIRLQSLYQFSNHAAYPCMLPFLSSTLICLIPKWLSFMVLPSSKTSDEFRSPPQQGMLATTSHPDDSTAHPSHYAIGGNRTE
jgi:hypothetical protein